ncbi:hypothetical protein [Liquorilactobacillus mali]|uniref:hypothetical protein n=1 Tax=Liquorilactobacillus mali TaxID=1618 RepID=UPI0039EC48BF
MKKGSILFINEKEAKTLITAEEAIKLSEQAFADFSDKKVINPVKLHTPLYPYHDGYTVDCKFNPNFWTNLSA